MCLSHLNLLLSLTEGNFQSQLYDKQSDKYLPANQDLWIFVEAKDPDDKVWPGRTEYLV